MTLHPLIQLKVIMNYIKKRDKSQQEVIDISEGFHLVLAPPGCGKTDILADRINQAIKSGVSPQDMLCLTFTNRASRGMLSRIKDTITTDTSEIFVGNVHRFCSQFLYENGFVPLNSSILDEFDVYSILLDLCSKDESTELDYSARKYYDDILDIQHHIYQLKNNHPKSVQKQINKKLELICSHCGLSPIDLFDKAEEINLGTFYSRELTEYLRVIKIAKRYYDYKNTYSVLDFDDLLLKTYTVISSPNSNHKRFKWIQVDEVQDLNPLQLAICDLLISEKDRSCIVYFGDEQQAIFSFLGASLDQLRILKERCGDNLHYLQNNYRSPSYLLNVYNEFANKELDTEPEFLPQPTKSENAQHNDLVIINSLGFRDEEENAVKISKKLLNVPIRHEKDQQRIAILVTKNEDADSIGDKFAASGIPYFKLSGRDAFASPAVQTLFSHISVCCFENNIISWAKIFRQLKLFKGTNQYAKSRHFIKNMSECMMYPSDLIQYEDSSYLNEFSKAYLGEIILFDTETTGLNIYEDDIVQIAALKIINGIVTDSFSIILETEKEIPLYLGEIQNPLVEEYNKESTHKYKRAEGLKLFLSFIGENNILVAHNANFDYHILDNYLKRDLLDNDFSKRYPTYFDTLKITKLVSPHLRSYKLKNLISAFNLDGHNSHLAQDDVEATKNLIDYCLKLFKPQQEKQEKFFIENRGIIDLFKAKYSKAWQHTQSRLFSKNQDKDKCLLTEELSWLYEYFIGLGLFKPCEKIEHIMRFLKSNVIDTVKELTLNEQISNHAIELGTYKEADLCESGVVKEKIFIATVHKAKGLEFENVLVMNAIEDFYPFYNSPNIQEDARKFYVAISRAKIRLFLMTVEKKKVFSKKYGKFFEFDAEKSRFVDCIEDSFEYYRSDNTEDISKIFANLILETHNQVADENNCTGENTGDEFDLPY